MRLLRNILAGFIWSVLGAYIIIAALTHIPAVQGWLGKTVSGALGDKLGTSVSVERVDLGFLNRVIIDGLTVDDQQGRQMLRASRMSLKIDMLPLLHRITGTSGKISVSSAQLFGMDCHLSPGDSITPANYQFVIDAFSSNDTTHTPLDIHVGSLIVRRCNVRIEGEKPVALNGISAHLTMPYLTDDSVSLMVKELAVKANTEGATRQELELRHLSLAFKADRHSAILKSLRLRTPGTSLDMSAEARYKFIGDSMDMASLEYEGHITRSTLTLSDFSPLSPSLKRLTTPVNLSLSASGTLSQINVARLRASTEKRGIDIEAKGMMAGINTDYPRWNADIDHITVHEDAAEQFAWIDAMASFPAGGWLSLSGEARGEGHEASARCSLRTCAGDAELRASVTGKDFTAAISTDGMDISRLTGNRKTGAAVADIRVSGSRRTATAPWKGWTDMENAAAECSIPSIEYNGYTFHGITSTVSWMKDGNDSAAHSITADIVMDDPNGHVSFNAKANTTSGRTEAALSADISDCRPQAMNLSDKWGDAILSTGIRMGGNVPNDLAAIKSLSDIRNAFLEINNLSLSSEDTDYKLQHLRLDAEGSDSLRTVALDSDFGEVELFISENLSLKKSGKASGDMYPLPVSTLLAPFSVSLPEYPASLTASSNATLHKSDWLNALFGIPLVLKEPLHFNASIAGSLNMINVHADASDFTYDGTTYRNTAMDISNAGMDTLNANIHTSRMETGGTKLDMSVTAQTAGSSLYTEIGWDNNHRSDGHAVKGTVKSTAEFVRDARGFVCIDVQMHPSEILVNDTVWKVHSSHISYGDKQLHIEDFAIRHSQQYILVSGLATDSPRDSITADLNDVDIGYILNLVNFHAVNFSGHASGKMCAKSVFSGAPDAYAILRMDDFLFQGGGMGKLSANVRWNKTEKQIDIDTFIDDGPGQATVIKGYVSPERHFIDLAFDAKETRMEFLEGFCANFLRDVEARATGELRLSGDLSDINLTGKAVVNGSVGISSLNTTYHLDNDTVTMIPNEIVLNNVVIHDDYGNPGIVNGGLHHKHLTRLTYDIAIEADNMLAYDFKDYGENTFFGTVFATGTCTIKGRSGSIDFDINATPGKNSFIEYDAASTDITTEQDFITWRDKASLTRMSSTPGEKTSDSTPTLGDIDEFPEAEMASDMHINFLINTTPEFTLRVLMDKQSGDYIALNGTGTIKAAYYNKGGFDMFGNYAVESGIYKLTIQNIMTKVFQFDSSSSIIFGGNPFDATLNLKALYTINSVPLGDLHVGNSFTSNNVRVDCIMNIGGTPLSPRVEFDLDLPTVSNDARQMVRSLINSEEEMNQQVIYLLSIGRFYAEDNTGAGDETKTSQTSLAMQSILSGTVSQQINNLLSSFVNTGNWNVGANISTGDEGWNNAEYEGLVSGRLFNNRLIINGQFGYRDNANATTSFIGDFDISYLLTPNGSLALKVYNQTNDRYFTKSSLNTQGIGLIMKKDFNSWRELFGSGKKKNKKKKTEDEK